jgi:hypothetical protein
MNVIDNDRPVIYYSQREEDEFIEDCEMFLVDSLIKR